jgi:hypothetical protein
LGEDQPALFLGHYLGVQVQLLVKNFHFSRSNRGQTSMVAVVICGLERNLQTAKHNSKHPYMQLIYSCFFVFNGDHMAGSWFVGIRAIACLFFARGMGCSLHDPRLLWSCSQFKNSSDTHYFLGVSFGK